MKSRFDSLVKKIHSFHHFLPLYTLSVHFLGWQFREVPGELFSLVRESDFSCFTLSVNKTVSLVCLKFFPLRSLSLDHLSLSLFQSSLTRNEVKAVKQKEITDVVPVKCMWSNPSQVTQDCSFSHIILCNTFVTEIAVSHTFKVGSFEKKRGREKCLTNEKLRETSRLMK